MFLYADDILVYVSNADISIPSRLTLFDHFGTMSGYKASYTFNHRNTEGVCCSLSKRFQFTANDEQ